MDNRNLRQGFLGDHFLEKLDEYRIAVIAVGGGGSQIVQALAHVGFKNYVIIDPAFVQKKHLNRLVGANLDDVKLKTPKAQVAKRMIEGLVEGANVETYENRWQEVITDINFSEFDLVFAGLDDLTNRRELESLCRSKKVPLIDIGLTVSKENSGYRMNGQVALSDYRGPCFRCYGFCKDDDLLKEEEGYGATGAREQVGFGNGILANSAVMLGVKVLSGWDEGIKKFAYYMHFSEGKLFEHLYLEDGEVPKCEHF